MKRTCYIFQKFEATAQSTDKDFIGGGETRTTTYKLVENWSQTPGPSQLEHLNETNSRGIWDTLVVASGRKIESTLPTGMPPQIAAIVGMSDDPPHSFVVNDNNMVGDFGLTREIIVGNPREFLSELSPVPCDYLPEETCCEGLIKGSDNILRTFPEDTNPKNGDCKIVYEYVKDGFDCSFIVQQTPHDMEKGLRSKFGVDKCHIVDKKFFGQCDSDLGSIWIVRKGKHGLHEMIDMAKQEQSQMMKILRIICLIGLIGGWILLFSPFTTALQVLPLLGGFGYFAVVIVAVIVGGTCFCTISTVAYVRYRPIIAFGLLALAAIIWGIVAWRLNIAAEKGD